MSLPRANTLLAEYMRFLEREIDRLQATADRRGELLKNAQILIGTAFFNHPVAAAIVAELADEGDKCP